MNKPLVVTLALVCLTGCSGKAEHHGPSEVDARVLSHLNIYIKDWNRVIKRWSNAYQSGSHRRFLRSYQGYTKKLHTDAVKLRVGADAIADEHLRKAMRSVGDAYEDQLEALDAVNDTVVNGDVKGGQRALRALREAARRKVEVAEGFADQYSNLSFSP